MCHNKLWGSHKWHICIHQRVSGEIISMCQKGVKNTKFVVITRVFQAQNAQKLAFLSGLSPVIKRHWLRELMMPPEHPSAGEATLLTHYPPSTPFVTHL